MAVTRGVYGITRRLPETERYGLTSQMRRAAVSIAANIGEGLGRGSPGDLERFLRIASGSAAELQVLLSLASELHQIDDEALRDRLEHVRRQLNLLVAKVGAARRAG
jgi:four helix bundle protein